MELGGRRVFITGGQGFLGSYIIPLLQERGAEVLVFSRRQAPRCDGARYLRGDVCEPGAVAEAMSGSDVVIHLACSPIQRYLQHPEEDLQINVRGSLNTLQAAKARNVRRFIYISTSQVYGHPQTVPIPEEHPTRPVNLYGASKLCGEIYCELFYRVYGLPASILRCCILYGIPLHGTIPPNVVSLFFQRVLDGFPPIIRGHKEHAIDLLHVADAAQAIILAILHDEAVGEVINIGSGSSIMLQELAAKVLHLADVGLEPEIQGEDENPEDFHLDVRKARALLAFAPSVSFDQGLAALLEWFRFTRVEQGSIPR